MGLFKNPNDPENKIIKAKIKEWLEQYFNVQPLQVQQIEEIPCRDPGCPDIFTKIVYSKDVGLQEFIIHKPLTFVRKVDIKALHTKDGNRF